MSSAPPPSSASWMWRFPLSSPGPPEGLSAGTEEVTSFAGSCPGFLGLALLLPPDASCLAIPSIGGGPGPPDHAGEYDPCVACIPCSLLAVCVCFWSRASRCSESCSAPHPWVVPSPSPHLQVLRLSFPCQPQAGSAVLRSSPNSLRSREGVLAQPGLWQADVVVVRHFFFHKTVPPPAACSPGCKFCSRRAGEAREQQFGSSYVCCAWRETP